MWYLLPFKLCKLRLKFNMGNIDKSNICIAISLTVMKDHFHDTSGYFRLIINQ